MWPGATIYCARSATSDKRSTSGSAGALLGQPGQCGPRHRRLKVPWPELRIVSEEQWAQVQRQIKLVSEKSGPKRIGGFNRTERSNTYLFSGLLVCGICRSGMTITGSSNGGSRPIYGCFAHRFRGASVCSNSLYIRQQTLERQLIDGLTNRILRPDMLEHALASFSEKLQQRLEEMQRVRSSLPPRH